MDEPSWERYGFIGGIVAGIFFAVRELQAWFKRTDTQSTQKFITPADVKELVLILTAKVDLMNNLFEAFQAEEARVHAHLELEIRDALVRSHRLDGDR